MIARLIYRTNGTLHPGAELVERAIGGVVVGLVKAAAIPLRLALRAGK